MKNLLSAAAAALLLLAAGCYQYDTQFEGPYEEGAPVQTQTKVLYEILTVEDGQIHLYNASLKRNKVLSGLPPGIEKAAINYAHDRIAYQVPGQNIAVVDTAGAILGAVSSSAGATWFDWHTNDRSLCVLNNFKLSVWGPSITPSITNLSQFFPLSAQEQEMCATITADGSVVSAYRYYDGFSVGYECRIVVVSPSGQKWDNYVSDYQHINWLRADRSGQHIVYGVSSGFTDPYLWRLDVAEKNNVERGKADLGAISPDGNSLLTWYSGNLEVYNQVTDKRFNFPTSNANLTALDW